MSQIQGTNRWQAFWARGGWWRSVLLVVTYLVLYVGAGLLVGALFGDRVDTDDLFASTESVLFGLTVPLLIGSALLAAFAASLGWFPVLFGPQPIRGRGWMWIAPALVVAAVLLRLLGIDYGSYASGVVVTTLLTGLLIGFAEEVATRGLVVKLLRDAGRSEWTMMVLSSLLFALMHATNALSGQEIGLVLATMGFTFGFGVCMYLTLRVTGNLIWPVLLHGLYDPTLFLATGGIDQAAGGEQSTLLTLAAPVNLLLLLVALVAVAVVRGPARTTDPGEVSR